MRETELIIEGVRPFHEEKLALAQARDRGFKLVHSAPHESIASLIHIMKAYLWGKAINLPKMVRNLPISLNLTEIFPTQFAQDVITCVRDLKYGEIVSYSEIGRRIDTRAFRAIGSVLKKNPFPLLIPCHRVIRKNGSVGGFMGTQGGEAWQVSLKQGLIAMERKNSSCEGE